MSAYDPRPRRVIGGIFWLSLYVVLSLLPLIVAYAYRDHPARDFWTEFSVALGFVALAMIGLQFAVTARFHHVAAPYGIDIVLRFHKQISILAASLAVAHPLILFAARPETLALLNVASAPWRARFALAATVGMLLLIAISVWRRRIGLPYGRWRLWHGILAVAALTFALAHVELVGWYIDLPWKRALWIAMALAVVGLLVHVRLVVPLRQLHRPWMVEDVTAERGRAWTLRLRPVGHHGIRFLPGQFAWLTLGRTPFAIEDHPFSISSSAEDRRGIDFTIKEAGDFTATVGAVSPGSAAYVEGPHGAFSVDRYEAAGCVFVAGGVGITPVISMLRTLADRDDPHPHLLVYGSRTWEEVTFREELDQLRRRLRLTVVHVLSEPDDDWLGERGRITTSLLDRHLPDERADHLYFVCGPPPMMDAVERSLRRAGVPWPNIYTERFNMV
jgi:predicted ferric reductase